MTAPGPQPAMAALAAELDRSRDGIDALAALVSDYVRDCAPEDRPAVMGRAQAVDALSQNLEALAQFARAIASGHSPADAAGAVPLSDLGARLLAACQGQSIPPPPASSGDLDLFD